MTAGGPGSEAEATVSNPARRLLAITLTAFVLTAGGNLLWEEQVTTQTAFGDPIYQPGPDSRLVSLLRSAPGSSYRELFFAVTGLLDVAGGGVLVVPGEGIVTEMWIENMARMELRIEPYPPEIDEATRAGLESHIRFEGTGWLGGPGSAMGPFQIIAASDDPEVMRLVFSGETALFVEDDLLEVGS